MKRIIIRNMIILSICLLGIYLLKSDGMNDGRLISLTAVFLTFTYWEYSRFKAKNKNIEDGINKMKKACYYSHDNLLMTQDRDLIYVKNELLWLEMDKGNKPLIDEGIQSLIDDFNALVKANRRFRDFVSGKDVQFVLIDNMGGIKAFELGSKTISYTS